MSVKCLRLYIFRLNPSIFHVIAEKVCGGDGEVSEASANPEAELSDLWSLNGSGHWLVVEIQK